MHRITLLCSRLLRSHQQACFFLFSILILVSIASQPRSTEAFGIPVARAETFEFAEHGAVLLGDGPPAISPIFQGNSEESAYTGFNEPMHVNLQHIDRRQDTATLIKNNAPLPTQGIKPGQAFHYKFLPDTHSSNIRDRSEPNLSKDTLAPDLLNDGPAEISEDQDHELGSTKRQVPNGQERSVYVTVTACSQPTYLDKSDRDDPPQLSLHVSPASDTTIGRVTQELRQGYALVTMPLSDHIYITVTAPNVKVQDTTFWGFDIAASVDEPYHAYVDSSLNLFMIDSDQNAALLITQNLASGTPPGQSTKDWLSGGPPLSIFVQQKNNTLINGLHRSYCGLQDTATFPGHNSLSSFGIETGLTTYGGSALEQQFYIPNLNATTTYYGVLSRPATSKSQQVGGGGGVYAMMTFHTKELANCAVLYNLTFCSSVAYAVPANPATYPSLDKLRAVYDEDARQKYQNFNYSLQQIPCNTTSSAQYSLNRTCDDCAATYKKWLCAVSIPRCADFIPDPQAHENTSFLQIRNAAQQPIVATPQIKPVTNHTLLHWLATNSSRNNATIAGKIQPGPYCEILPCVDLCYDIVRSCPATFGFGCPYAGRGLEQSYGSKEPNINGGVTCSEPGAVFGLSGVSRGIHLRMGVLWLCVAAATSFVLT